MTPPGTIPTFQIFVGPNLSSGSLTANIGVGVSGTGAGNLGTAPDLSITVMPGADASRAGASPEVVVVARNPALAGLAREFARQYPQLGNVRFVVAAPTAGMPQTAPTSAEVAELQTLLSSPALLAAVQSAESHPQAGVLNLGSQMVFSAPDFRPHAAETVLHGSVPEAHTPQGTSGSHAPHEGAAQAKPSNASATFSQPASSGSVSVDTARITEVARDILVALQMLPPGVGTEQALPRLQEVLRLWSSGSAQGGELPAHVAEVVDKVLKSALLATALTDRSPAPTLRNASSADAQRGSFGAFGGGLFSEGRPDFRTGTLTRTQIADAVMNALAGTPASQTSIPMPARPSVPVGAGDTIPMPASNASSAPGAGVPADKQGASVRADAARVDTGAGRPNVVDRATADAKQVRLHGDEQRDERMDTVVDELDQRRAAHDQESQTGSEEDTHAVEALWNELHTALDRAGFVAPSGSLRPLEFSEDGRAVLTLIATRLPEGWDLIDGLSLVDARMGLSPEAGAVNNALHRLASYRTTWKNDKVRAVLEPLHDAFVALELVADDIILPEESDVTFEDLKGFQTHVAAAQMILDRPRWMARIGEEEDREEISKILPDVEDLLERSTDKLPSSGPAYFRAAEGSVLRH